MPSYRSLLQVWCLLGACLFAGRSNAQSPTHSDVPKQWHFVWDSLVAPNNLAMLQAAPLRDYDRSWNDDLGTGHGVATYYCHIDSLDPEQIYGLIAEDVYTSFRLFANGKEVARNGVVGRAGIAQPEWRPLAIALPQGQSLDLVLQIANYSHYRGGTTERLVLAPYEGAVLRMQARNAVSAALCAVCLVLGISILITAKIYQSKTAAAYYTLFCFMVAYRAVGAENYLLHQLLPDLPFGLVIRLEYLTYYLMILCFWEVCNQVLVQDLPRQVLRGVRFGYLLLVGSVLVLSIEHFTQLLPLVQPIVILNLGYGFVCFLRWGWRGGVRDRFVVLGYVVMATVSTVVILGQLVGSDYSELMVYALLCFEMLAVYHFTTARAIQHVQSLERQALAASEAKSSFLATMSHEIRTPMNGVLGMTSLLAGTQLSAEQRQYVDTIRFSGQNLITIINDILDFSKVDAGHMSLELQPVDLDQILRDGLELSRGSAQIKGVALLMHRETGAQPLWIQADPTRITQIVINLLSNAVKFTEPGGTVTLSLVSRAVAGQTFVELQIQDTGIGMNDAQMAQLFNSFQQADATISRRFGGTGLGLAISKRLAELMGGTITVSSSPGVGSTFTFGAQFASAVAIPVIFTPAATATAARAGFASETPVPTALVTPLRILVAEDHPINQRLIATILKKWGYEPDLVGNGLEAIAAIARQPYDLIFMDMQMPECDGLAATREIRRLHPTLGVRIVALTANAQASDRKACLEAGMQGFIAKPFRQEEIAEVLNTTRVLGAELVELV